ncbi:response regulator transcription factor, partial [Escherichia coli]|uniref:response regulator transcription factor n=1 Tax=Escherichia coli TaxID=562 RepID=UPI00227F90C7
HALLTTSEVEVLRHISQGMSVTQIATRLKRSKKTVSTHKKNIQRKTGAGNLLELVAVFKELAP